MRGNAQDSLVISLTKNQSSAIIVRVRTIIGGAMKKDFKISDYLHSLCKEMYRIIGANISKYGITPQQGRIIRFLALNQENPVYQKDVEAFLNIRKSSVSSAIKNLEKSGLITRSHNPEDGRYKRINLTAAGLSIYEETRKNSQLVETKLRTNLEDAEIEFLEKTFQKLKKNLETRRKKC
jgi:DNA-binding MarR family transcriptional regulator